jgi:hypothetical protein
VTVLTAAVVSFHPHDDDVEVAGGLGVRRLAPTLEKEFFHV